MKLAQRLRQLELFAHFGDSQLERLAGSVSRSRYPAGVTVLKEGDPTQDAYLIDTGRIRIQRATPYGKYPLAVLESGDMFGEAAFVDAGARSGDAFAETATDLLILNPLALTTLIARDQGVALGLYWAFWRSLSRKLRATNESLAQFFSHGVPPSIPAGRSARHPTGEFHVDIAAKRDLFLEQKLASMEINFLASLSKEKKLQAGETIFREGDAGDAMYVVLEGRVMISKHIPGAGEEALAFLERGDYFGEMALIDNEPRSAEAKASDGGAVVLAIPREVVNQLLGVQRVSSLRLLRILCSLVAKRLREIDDKIVTWYILAGGALGGPEEQHPSES